MSAFPEPLPGAPRVRASYVKHVLECVHRLPDGQSADILDRLGPAVSAVEGATRVDWLPHEVPLAFVLAVDEALGREGMRALFLAAAQSSLRGHLLAPLFSAVANLFELAPERILRSAPAGFTSIWRNAGEIAVESPMSGCVVLRHAPIPVPLQAPAFLAATAASFEAVPVECGLPATSAVEFDGNHTARYIVRW